MSDIIALDVSKGHSYCVYYQDGKCITEYNFGHNKTGFDRLIATVKCANKPTFYFEATGIYSRPIERFCRDNKIPYALLNPLELHLKTESMRRLKSDDKDAHKIARSAYDNSYRLMCFQNPIYLKLRELDRFYGRVEKEKRLNQVRLHTELQQTFPEIEDLFSSGASRMALKMINQFPHPDMVLNLSRTKLKNIFIANTDKRLSKTKALEYAEKLLKYARNSCPASRKDDIEVQEVQYYSNQLMDNIVQKNKLKRQLIELGEQLPEFKIILSVPGIGELTVAQLLGEVGDFTRFDTSNQINAYVGIDLIRYQSGQYSRGDHINKRGNPAARMVLYTAVTNMIMHQSSAPNHIVDYYYRLKKQPAPKRNKVAIVACMGKTLKCLFSMIKNGTLYNYKHANPRFTEIH
ncbi:IS110 family transposase [Companilactobacillus sp.]|uniref:IS110 family transposase n=1 Tax=Companilactobacillus sp. TaxID=2767905 RepID=UPI00262B5940|nr:IS110 family transposase [Companilactobacillus sp.]